MTQVTKQGADGKLDHWVKANWDDVPAEHNGYGVKVTIDGDSRYYRADDSKFMFQVKAPESVQVEVRTRAANHGDPSDYCAPAVISVTKKGTGPAQATGLQVKRRPKANRLKWTKCADTDYKETAILRRATVSDPWDEIDRVSGTSYLDDDESLAKGTNYKYKIVHYNRSDVAASDSAEVNNTVEFIGTSDTDAAVLAAPTGISLSQANRDVNADGKVDTALRATFSGGVSGAAGYEVQWEDSAGQSATVRADSGSWWFMANTTRSYRVRWRTINWVGAAGAWSSYTGYVTPSPTTGAPANPTGVAAFQLEYGISVTWNDPTNLDHSHSEVALKLTTSTPSDSDVHASTTGNRVRIFKPWDGLAYYSFVRHVNTSGLKSGWTMYGIAWTPQKVAYIDAGAGGSIDHNNLGTSLGGSANAGAGSATLLLLQWKCTSTTAGVTVNLGSKTQTFDFIDQAPFTMISWENGGGSFSSSKSGGGTVTGAELVAITLK